MACHVRRLKVEAVYHSSHPRPAGLTVTSLVSMERLQRLEGLCASWAGPLVAAVYLPLVADRESPTDDALQTIWEIFHKCGPGLRLCGNAVGGAK